MALGSGVEGLASIIVIWRFTGARTLSATAERTAQKAVAVSFFLLAPYIAVQSIRDLAVSHHAGGRVLGIVLTASSLVVMAILGVAKQRLGRRLDSEATSGEGVQNLLCAAQAGAVLLGLALTAEPDDDSSIGQIAAQMLDLPGPARSTASRRSSGCIDGCRDAINENRPGRLAAAICPRGLPADDAGLTARHTCPIVLSS